MSTDPTFLMMECYPDSDHAVIDEYPDLERPYNIWIRGTPFGPVVPEPLEFEIFSAEQEPLLPYYDAIVPLMREDLLKALAEAGVDNLETYQALIHFRSIGLEITNYRAVNIIGIVDAIDRGGSELTSVGLKDDALGTVMADSLVIAEDRIPSGLLLFRPLGLSSAVVVHRSVAKFISEKPFPEIEFIDPADWSG